MSEPEDGIHRKTTPDTPVQRKVKGFGYIPDLPDHRDFYYALEQPVDTPPVVDLRDKMPPVYTQGELGSCTAQALGAMCQYEMMQRDPNAPTPSRLFIYWNEREVIGQTDSDSGSTLRDGIRTMSWYGFCEETIWPYKIERFTQKPVQEAYTNAKPFCIRDYRRVRQRLSHLRTCLAEGNLIVIGIMVYDSFMSARKTGVVPMPSVDDTEEGGHAVLLVGYDDTKKVFHVRNSWGPKWGNKGYFTLPYEYVLNSDLTGDLWTIRTVP